MKAFASILFFIIAFIAEAQTQDNTASIEKDSLQSVLIEEIEVIASRNNQYLRNGSLITEVRNTTLSELGNCRDVLSQLPGIKSDEDNIEIIGRGVAQIYINGRKLLDKSEIDRISSKDIKNVEVIFNPGAKYGAETKGVILIKTIKKQGDGLSGSIQATGRQARFFSQSDNIFLNYRTRGVDIFGTFNYDYSRRYQKQHNMTSIHTDLADYSVSSEISIMPKSKTYISTFGANWQITSNNYIGIKYEYSATPNYTSQWLTHQTVSINNDVQDEISYETNWRGYSQPVHLFNQYYQGKTSNLNVTINNDYYYRFHRNIQSIIEKDFLGEERLAESNNLIRSSMFASKGVAEYSFSENTLEFGYEVTLTNRNDVFKNEGSGLMDSDDRIRETTGAGFIAVNIPIKDVELYTGIRYEHTSSDYFENGNHIMEQSRKYSHLYPNIDFTFPIKNAKFTLSYEAKTKRPLYSQLSNSIQYDDRFTYETGNPLLKSEQIHNISLAGIYKWLFFSASYSYNKDAIISVIRPYEYGKPQNIMTYDNFNHLSKYNIIISASPRILKWSPRLRLNLSGQDFSIGTFEGEKNLNNPILFFNFYNSLSLGKGYTINGDITGHTYGDMDVVTLKPSWQINIGLSKSIKDWFFQVQATDVFKTARNSMITHGTHMTLDKWNYSDTQAIRLMIRYAFNTTINKYKGKGAGISERNRLL